MLWYLSLQNCTYILKENHLKLKKDLQVMNKLPSQGVQLPLKPEKKEGY